MLFEQSVLVVPIAQLVEVTDSAVLGGVAEVESSNPTLGHKYFSAFTALVDLLYIYNVCMYVCGCVCGCGCVHLSSGNSDTSKGA